MHSRLFLIVAISAAVLCYRSASAQNRAVDTTPPEWTVQYPGMDFSHPERLYAVNDHLLYILSDGFVLRSTDAGATWTTSNLPGCFTAYSAAFWGDSLAWLVGNYGSVYKSTDGGRSWVYHKLPLSAINLRYVTFRSATLGWAGGTGGAVLKTTNGGDTWTLMNYWKFFDIEATSFVQSIRTVSDSVVWVTHVSIVTNNINIIYKTDVVRTTDGGVTWDSLYYHWISHFWINRRNPYVVDDSHNSEVLDTSLDASNMYACSKDEAHIVISNDVAGGEGYARVGWTRWSTYDGGRTWDSVPLPRNGVCRFVNMFDCGSGWGADCDSASLRLYRTAGAGSPTWVSRPMPSGSHFMPSLYDFLDTLTGFCYVYNGNNTISIFRTTDGAATWETRSTHLLNNGTLTDVYFLNADTGWTAGTVHASGLVADTGGIVLRTFDRGAHWNIVNTTPSQLHNVRQVKFVDPNNGWILGDSVYATHDGGRTWASDRRFPRDPVRPGVQYVHIDFPTHNVGWVMRSDWMTFRTTDAGVSWAVAHDRDTSVRIGIARAMDTATILAVGSLYDTTYEFRILNGGARWQDFRLVADIGAAGNPPTFPAAIYFLDSITGWFVDTANSLYITNDGGLTWTFVVAPLEFRPARALYFSDSLHGWLLKGDEVDVSYDLFGVKHVQLESAAAIERLVDGGLSTSAEPCISQSLNAMTFVGDSLGWAVGENLTIYHYFHPDSLTPHPAPFMVLSPPGLDFGSVRPGRFSGRVLTVLNVGTDTLRIYGATVTNDPFHAYRLATFLPTTVPPGDTLMMAFNFDPAFIGLYDADVAVYSNDDTQSVQLHGLCAVPNAIHYTGLVPDAGLASYPNPFTQQTTIALGTMIERSNASSSLTVYDMHGTKIPATHWTVRDDKSVVFSGAGLPAGEYLCVARHGAVSTACLIVLKK